MKEQLCGTSVWPLVFLHIVGQRTSGAVTWEHQYGLVPVASTSWHAYALAAHVPSPPCEAVRDSTGKASSNIPVWGVAVIAMWLGKG